MKKIAYVLSAVILCSGSVTALTAYADTGSSAVSADSVSINLVSTAKTAESQAKANGLTSDADIAASVTTALEAAVIAAIKSGASAATMSTAVTEAQSTSGLSPAVATAFSNVQSELAALESEAGAGATNNTNNPPAPLLSAPPPPSPGATYNAS